MKYKLVGDDNLEEFKESVDTMLKWGWRPQGGICIVPIVPLSPNIEARLLYYQAFIFEEEEAKG